MNRAVKVPPLGGWVLPGRPAKPPQGGTPTAAPPASRVARHKGLADLRKQLRACANPEDARNLAWFFKTGPGEYAEGDRFLGIRVPVLRKMARAYDGLGLADTQELLHSAYHEERLLALLMLVRCYQRGDDTVRRRIFHLYLGGTKWVNNWDLVDLTAPHIVGAWLLRRSRHGLERLARSGNLWERRIAVLATLAFIREGQFQDTLRLCRRLLKDEHDLMHKACGWMLREVGKRNQAVLEAFLKARSPQMPRTMLRYAIERLPEARRAAWLERPSDKGPSRARAALKTTSAAKQTKIARGYFRPPN
jgi:3-methyladenine DNA glycosylase AlkD